MLEKCWLVNGSNYWIQSPKKVHTYKTNHLKRIQSLNGAMSKLRITQGMIEYYAQKTLQQKYNRITTFTISKS